MNQSSDRQKTVRNVLHLAMKERKQGRELKKKLKSITFKRFNMKQKKKTKPNQTLVHFNFTTLHKPDLCI